MTVNELAIACKSDKSYIEELWLSVYKLICMWARRFYSDNTSRYEIDDLVQAAYIALLNAIDAYPEDSEYQFTTYLSYHCRTEFREVVGISGKKEIKTISLESGIFLDGDLKIEDVIGDESAQTDFDGVEDRIYYDQLHQALDQALCKIPKKQKQIVNMHFYQGKSFEEIGDSFNCTSSYVGQQKNAALRALRCGEAYECLKEFDYRTEAYKHTGLSCFKIDLSSSVEKTAIKKISLEERYKRLTQKDIAAKKQRLLKVIA